MCRSCAEITENQLYLTAKVTKKEKDVRKIWRKGREKISKVRNGLAIQVCCDGGKGKWLVDGLNRRRPEARRRVRSLLGL